MDIVINMEPKKDISIYKTKDRLNKNQDFSSVGRDNPVHKEQQKEVASDADVTPCDFNVFVNKKTKKLTTALYMVTSFLSDNEPIKWKLRKCSVSLFSGISNVRNKSVSEVDNVFAEYSVLVDEITSLLEVATASKLVSEMNFLILKKEYIALRDVISSDEYMEEKSGKFVFPNGFFDGSKVLPPLQKKDSIPHKDVYLKKGLNSAPPAMNNQKNSVMTDKGHLLSKGQDVSKRQQYQVRQTKDRQVSVRKTEKLTDTKLNRREVILKLFKSQKGKEFTIKDISHEVSGCSEKTIQRELVSMVTSGVLKKRGERRWSRYSCK